MHEIVKKEKVIEGEDSEILKMNKKLSDKIGNLYQDKVDNLEIKLNE